MGNVCTWLTSCMFPEEQGLWHAAHRGDLPGLAAALAKLTPATRRYLEWQDPCSGRTPVAEAAARGRLPCVRALVAAGANANAKDYRGNTPLHLACRYARGDVTRFLLEVPNVMPFDVNMAMLTPLDLARDRLARGGECHDGGGGDVGISGGGDPSLVGYERCIEELEKRFYVYSGWLYEKTETLLSMVSGLAGLNGWGRRFCIVLQRGTPDVLELALFAMKPGQVRPACPTTVVLYHIRPGIVEVTDAKWFNRKDFAFSLTGSCLRRSSGASDSQVASSLQSIEFAAVDAEGLQMWKSFFLHQQEQFAAQARAFYHPTVSYPAPSASTSAAGPVTAAATTTASPAPPAASEDATAQESQQRVRTRAEQEDEDLRRAIELSLLTSMPTRYQHTSPLESSAPAWADDDEELDRGLLLEPPGSSVDSSSGSVAESDGLRKRATASATTPDAIDTIDDMTARARVPSFAAVGECIVCFDGPQAAVCVPCGHNAVCMQCAEEILESGSGECPVCRRRIRELIKLYRV